MASREIITGSTSKYNSTPVDALLVGGSFHFAFVADRKQTSVFPENLEDILVQGFLKTKKCCCFSGVK